MKLCIAFLGLYLLADFVCWQSYLGPHHTSGQLDAALIMFATTLAFINGMIIGRMSKDLPTRRKK